MPSLAVMDDASGPGAVNSSLNSSGHHRRNALGMLQSPDVANNNNNNNDVDFNSVEFGPVNAPGNTMSSAFCGFGSSSASSSGATSSDDNEYVGLINQAMTCYLNSLIQTLYMTPEFRNGIYR